MKTQQFPTYEAMCSQIGDEIIAELARNPRMMLCVAAGHTSLGVFKALRDIYGKSKADFSQASFVAMDEWMGMSADTPNSCGTFLKKELLDVVPFGKVRLFDGAAASLDDECRSVEAFIETESQNGAIDYLVLGSGMNGHLALNEPGTPFDSQAHVTELDAVTIEVGQKYFPEKTALTGGITLGIANFKKARRTVLMFSGAHKAEILAKTLQAPVSTELPATAVRTFENGVIYYDADAAAGLTGS